MSHVVSIRTQVRDIIAIRSACRRLQLAEPVYGPTKLFASTNTGWAVVLYSWNYPVVCNVETGTVEFDKYHERWGKQVELDRFLQAYAVEKAKIEARKLGHSATEYLLANGSIRVHVFAERLEELNEELTVLNSEASELEQRIANNVVKLLEG